LVVLGLIVGTEASLWFSARDGNDGSAGSIGQAVNVLPAPRLSDDDLAKMAVAGVNFAPAPDSAPGTLQLRVRTEQPLVVSGNVDDANVRRVLTYVVANGERFDPGVRLDCLDFLRARTGDAEVRRALLSAARKDQNPAVRMKALEALRDSATDPSVLETLLDTLQHDANPGVRVEAVNLLVRSLEGEMLDAPEVPGAAPAPDAAALPTDPEVERVVRALEALQRRDPNRYVRLRSAAALRQIGPRDLQ
jgi:HEAT repeat protein